MMQIVYIFVLSLAWSSVQCSDQWAYQFAKNFAEGRADTNSIDDTATTPAGYSGDPIIFPGTKWCGAGDIAKNYDDLGEEAETDKCCRTHDHCNDTIAPGKNKENLENDSEYTKLSCECDGAFYDCLDKVDDFTANTIGNLYFNMLSRECFEYDYPLTGNCKEYGAFNLYCKVYEQDTTVPKQLKWTKPQFFNFF